MPFFAIADTHTYTRIYVSIYTSTHVAALRSFVSRAISFVGGCLVEKGRWGERVRGVGVEERYTYRQISSKVRSRAAIAKNKSSRGAWGSAALVANEVSFQRLSHVTSAFAVKSKPLYGYTERESARPAQKALDGLFPPHSSASSLSLFSRPPTSVYLFAYIYKRALFEGISRHRELATRRGECSKLAADCAGWGKGKV